MEIKIKRNWKKPGYTIGVFYVNDAKLCNSLEDTDRGLNSNWTEAAIKLAKIYGHTAIPAGTYKVILSVSQKFKKKSWAAKYGGLVPELLNVKGFSGVRIHPGNGPEDTEGCILLGDNTAVGRVTNSVKRYYELMDKYLMPSWKRNEEIIITIE